MKINAIVALIVMGVWFYTGLIWQTQGTQMSRAKNETEIKIKTKIKTCTLQLTDRVGYSHLVTGEAYE